MQRPLILLCGLGAALILWATPGSASGAQSTAPRTQPGNGCSGSAKQCLASAIEAMGGRERLEAVHNLRLEEIGHTLLMEQSYRQEPFISSYERVHETIDFEHGRLYRETETTWPESDPGQSLIKATVVATASAGIRRGQPADTPASLDDLDTALEELGLGPARVLLTALAASDLHFESSVEVRSTPHIAIAFNRAGTTVRVLLNPFNHLPDAVETVQEFHDFWYFWGDVRQRTYFDNWQVLHGLIYPTNLVVERNGALWRSVQVLQLDANVPVDDSLFQMDASAAARSAQGRGWNRPFNAGVATELAPGITMFPGAWNSTVVQEPDGIYILEAPISAAYMQAVIDEARKRYPGMPIKGVFSTSDSWPHTGGVRQSVALGIPVYILDLNQPLLERLIAAPHNIKPDLLQRHPQHPQWNVVSRRTSVGRGRNRVAGL